MGAIDRYFWFLCVAVVAVNGLIFYARAARLGATQPELRPGYEAIALGFMKWLALPFLLMAIGTAAGLSRSFVLPRGSAPPTPFDLLSYAVMAAIMIRGLVWIFGQGGAEFMATHHRVFNHAPSSPGGVKFFWVVMNAVVVAVGVFNFMQLSAPR